MPKSAPGFGRRRRRVLDGDDYVADRRLATSVFLALKMGRPLFLEGEAGVGKTEIAKVLATALGKRSSGCNATKASTSPSAVYEWNYPRQMIEIRLAESAGHASIATRSRTTSSRRDSC